MTGLKATDEDVRCAYRLLLEREPDSQGKASFEKLISGGLEVRSLVDTILASEEYAIRSGNEPVEVDLGEYRIYVRPSDRDIGGAILAGHAYEASVTKEVRELVQPGQTFVDIGANIGYFTALAAHLVGPKGKVVAVEPLDKNLQLIYATIWRNRFEWVEILPFAASDATGVLGIATHAATSNGQIELSAARDKRPAAFAAARPMDEALAGLVGLDIVKIDIEGHELIALRGFARALERHRPVLITEFHPKCMRENSGIDPADYLAFLFEYARSVHVLRHEGGRVECVDSQGVLREWERAEVRFATGGAGHLNLLARPR